MLVHPDHARPLRELGAQDLEAAPAHVAAAGVEPLSLGVVPVGHDHRLQAEVGGQVQALQPFQVGSGLVYLVDGQGLDPGGQGRGRGQRHRGAAGEQIAQGRGQPGVLPDPEGVARRARSGEHVTGGPHRRQHPFQGDRSGAGGAVGGHFRLHYQAGAEEAGQPLRQDGGVLLEPVGGVEHQHLPGAGRLDAQAVGGHQPVGGLPRSHQYEAAGAQRLASPASSSSQPAVRRGCWAWRS